MFSQLFRDHTSHSDRASNLASSLGFGTSTHLRIGQHEQYFIFEEHEFDQIPEAHRLIESLLTDHVQIEWFEKQTPRKRFKRDYSQWNDPLLSQEWFIGPVNEATKTYGLDASYLWNLGFTGQGVQVALIDDGLDMTHPDIADSFDQAGSWDFNTRSALKVPKNFRDNHGTRCGGQIVGKPNNSVCGVGISYGSKIAGIRLISEDPTDSSESAALTYKYQLNDIYSSSWGPSDDGRSIDGPGYLGRLALEEGVTNGREGLGSIYVFASGNGGNLNDICTYDGYANSIYTVTIGAVTKDAKWPYYAEPCAAQLVSAYSGDGVQNIATTDISEFCAQPPCCTNDHFGTSAAAPFASSMIALMLQMKPHLSWREVQHALVRSTIQNDPNDSDWTQNGAGLLVSHKYGFGVINGRKMLNATLSQTPLPAQSKFFTAIMSQQKVISLNSLILEVTLSVTAEDLLKQDITGYSNIKYLEHVQLFVDISHPNRGALTIMLTSPSNTTSVLAMPRTNDDSVEGIRSWTFMTVRNWNESPLGTWTIQISDKRHTGTTGTLNKLQLILNGMSCSPAEYIHTSSNKVECPWEALKKQIDTQNQNRSNALIAGLVAACFAIVFVLSWRYRRLSKSDQSNPLQPSITKTASVGANKVRSFLRTATRPNKPSRLSTVISNVELTEIVSPASSFSPRPPPTPVYDMQQFQPSNQSSSRTERLFTLTRPRSSPNLLLNTNVTAVGQQLQQDAGLIRSPMAYEQNRPSSLLVNTVRDDDTQKLLRASVEDLQSPKSPKSKQQRRDLLAGLFRK